MVNGGFVQVAPDRVTLMANEAEAAGDIDRDKARADLKQSEEDLARAELPLRRWTRPSTWPRRLKRVSICWQIAWQFYPDPVWKAI